MPANRAARKTYRLPGLDDMAARIGFESAVDRDKPASLVEAAQTADHPLKPFIGYNPPWRQEFPSRPCCAARG